MWSTIKKFFMKFVFYVIVYTGVPNNLKKLMRSGIITFQETVLTEFTISIFQQCLDKCKNDLLCVGLSIATLQNNSYYCKLFTLDNRVTYNVSRVDTYFIPLFKLCSKDLNKLRLHYTIVNEL